MIWLAIKRWRKAGKADNQTLALLCMAFHYYYVSLVHCMQASGPEGAKIDIMHAGHRLIVPFQAFVYFLAIQLGALNFDADGMMSLTIFPRVLAHPLFVGGIQLWQFSQLYY